jgi:hypothetical protein
VAKAAGWVEDATKIDGLTFPNLALGLIHALWHGGVLSVFSTCQVWGGV